MERFWLLFAGTAAGMVIAAAAATAVFYWWFACDGWSKC